MANSLLKGQKLDLVTTTDGETHIASIGVRDVFRFWVAGGEAGVCMVKMTSCSPMALSLVVSVLSYV